MMFERSIYDKKTSQKSSLLTSNLDTSLDGLQSVGLLFLFLGPKCGSGPSSTTTRRRDK